MWAVWRAQTGRPVRMAAQTARTAGQLLQAVPLGLREGALRGQQTAVHRSIAAPQASACRGAGDLPDRVLQVTSLRGLRRDRPGRSRVRPPQRRQGVQHRRRASKPQLAEHSRRDRQMRRGLCKLSSTQDRSSRRLRACGGSSTVEPRPSKAMMRVRFPSAASEARRGAASLGPRARGCGGRSRP